MKSLAVVVGALQAIGCGTPDATTGSSGAIPIVESAQPEWGPGARRIAAEPLLEIGASEGGGPEMFAGLDMARFLESGQIVVSDGGANRVVVFDSTGAHAATLGRPGQGPGEFQDVARVYPFPGDSVATFDFGLSRIQVFSLTRGSARSVPANHEDRRAPLFGVLGSGSFLSYQALPLDAPPTDGSWDSLRVIAIDRDGSEAREIARVARSVPPADPRSPRALAPRSFLAAAPDGFYWARSDRYEILKFDSTGAVQRIMRRPVEPEALGAAEWREYREGTIEGARRLAGEDAARRYETLLQDVTFAPTRPLFGEAFVDRGGRLWVSEVAWPSRFDPPRAWSVFSSTGHWLGDVAAPPGLHVQDATRDHVLGIWRDELGVEYLRVHELIGGQPP